MLSNIYGRPCQAPDRSLDPRLRSGGAARKLRQGGAGAWHHRGLGQLSYPPTRTADGAPPVYSPSAQGRADRGGRGDRARGERGLRGVAREFRAGAESGRDAAFAHHLANAWDELADLAARAVSRSPPRHIDRTRTVGPAASARRRPLRRPEPPWPRQQNGNAPGRERTCPYVSIPVVAGA